MISSRNFLWGLLLSAGACVASPAPGIEFEAPRFADKVGGPTDACGDLPRMTPLIYGGNREAPPLGPSQVALPEAQQRAILWFRWGTTYPNNSPARCSAVLVTDRWVLTAAHCVDGGGVLELVAGDDPGVPLLSHGAVVPHDSLSFCEDNDVLDQEACLSFLEHDMALVELTSSAQEILRTRVQPEPIPLNHVAVDASWIGQSVLAAGYGIDGSYGADRGGGVRRFLTMRVDRLVGERMVLSADGARGLCSGDSGGPVLAFVDGRWAVVGVSTRMRGTEDCLNGSLATWATRVDLHRDWATGVMDGCGDLDFIGACTQAGATWCTNRQIVTEACPSERPCGWDPVRPGFRCVAPGSRGCGNVTAAGRCQSGKAEWCDSGVLRTRLCGYCGQECVITEGLGAHCVNR